MWSSALFRAAGQRSRSVIADVQDPRPTKTEEDRALRCRFQTGSRTQKQGDAVMVGLHTCGDLAPSTLRMFAARRELASVCSVGCCYHLLTEQFDPATPPTEHRWTRYEKERNGHCAPNHNTSPPTQDQQKQKRRDEQTNDEGRAVACSVADDLQEQSWFCGRNARMSACLALERVTVGQGRIQPKSPGNDIIPGASIISV
ncbi:hypothetical protein CRUP_027730 [Coryphaenoides rupestris]|nr:hypothetical protein CRUP_027730 [Coryphaenoides rupestris]